MLEFPADDTAGGDHEDALCEMSFHVPKESDRFGGEETVSAAEVRRRLHCTTYSMSAALSFAPQPTSRVEAHLHLLHSVQYSLPASRLLA